ncbi:MAG: polysaccharide biosynthesis/export family protein [Armatimonadetes bacterium]|nr:polysaccharide biosynthesis/export family protein [Armatimonadota bacterium]
MRKIAVALVLLLIGAVAAMAQEGNYRLQQEDVLEIQILDNQQIRSQVQIGKDGNITAPFIGALRAEGKTIAELQEDLKQEYIRKLRFRDPQVSVVVVRFRSIFVTVGGAVGRAGRLEARPTDTVLTMVQQAQPITQNGVADLKHATLQRAGTKELIPLDLHAMLIRGDLSQNYSVEDGDIINIPQETKNRILVLGAVQRPGTILYTDPMTLSDAISTTGGPIQYRSKMSEIVITRERPGLPGNYVRIKSNYVRFLSKGDANQNIVLQPGDVVFVPDTKTPDGGRIGDIAGTVANIIFTLDRIGIKFLK